MTESERKSLQVIDNLRNEKVKLEDENRVLMHALREIINTGTYGTDIHSKEVVRSAEAKIAYEILNQ